MVLHQDVFTLLQDEGEFQVCDFSNLHLRRFSTATTHSEKKKEKKNAS